MNARTSPGFWRQFARESVVGRRGIIKINSLWFPLGIILLGSPGPAGRFCYLAAAVFCWSFAATAVNDLSELREDRAAGKTRWMGMLAGPVARCLPALFAAAGLALLAAAGAPAGTLASYFGAVALGAAYSLRPVRLKERGAWGLASYGAACAVANVVLPWTWLGGDLAVISVLGTAVFLDKWVNLHFHQIVDHDADVKQGMRTYAVRVGPETARRSLGPGTTAASFSLATAVAYAAWRHPELAGPVLAVTGGALILSAIHAAVARRRLPLLSALSRELPWPYLGLTLGVFRAVPLVLFLELAGRTSSMRPAFVIVTILLVADWILSYRYRYE